MKVIVTGMSGTIGTQLQKKLESSGHKVVGWDRTKVPYTDYHSMEAFLRAEKPQVIYHLAVPSKPTGTDNESWLVNYQWTSELAWLCRTLDIQFIFISTVMVFSNYAKGPFTPDSRADASEGYGYEKRLAEERVFYQNPGATVIRLGWQIGENSGSNNMVDFIENRIRTDGLISCSTLWYPACSYLADTVEVLEWVQKQPPGLYMFDSNEKWSFYQIAFALNQVHGKKWKIVPGDNFTYDQRMQDPRVPVHSLSTHLKTLK